jgi:hypothetical protein
MSYNDIDLELKQINKQSVKLILSIDLGEKSFLKYFQCVFEKQLQA